MVWLIRKEGMLFAAIASEFHNTRVCWRKLVDVTDDVETSKICLWSLLSRFILFLILMCRGGDCLILRYPIPLLHCEETTWNTKGRNISWPLFDVTDCLILHMVVTICEASTAVGASISIYGRLSFWKARVIYGFRAELSYSARINQILLHSAFPYLRYYISYVIIFRVCLESVHVTFILLFKGPLCKWNDVQKSIYCSCPPCKRFQ